MKRRRARRRPPALAHNAQRTLAAEWNKFRISYSIAMDSSSEKHFLFLVVRFDLCVVVSDVHTHTRASALQQTNGYFDYAFAREWKSWASFHVETNGIWEREKVEEKSDSTLILKALSVRLFSTFPSIPFVRHKMWFHNDSLIDCDYYFDSPFGIDE